jgi:hypothetical protein
MIKGLLGAAALALVLRGAAPAFAEDYSHKGANSSYGVSAEGGFGDYTGGLSQFTTVGPQWGVQLNGSMGYFGLEAAYVGSTNKLESFDGFLVRNGAEGMLKVYGTPNSASVRPYVGAGAGFSVFDPSGSAEPIVQEDTVFTIPVAAGLEYNTGALSAGLRANWSPLFGEEVINPVVDRGENAEGTYIGGQLTLGGRF